MVRRRKRNHSTSTSSKLSITGWRKRMDQVGGDLEDMYKKRSVTDQRQTIHAIHRWPLDDGQRVEWDQPKCEPTTPM
jgi:hypothetical protein